LGGLWLTVGAYRISPGEGPMIFVFSSEWIRQ
jgi:hypothetical protein